MKKLAIISPLLFLFPHFLYAQNVGIGTSTPLEKLHVAGNLKIDTIKPSAIKLTPDAGIGKILTSDAAGNANWQTNNAAAAGNIGFGVWGDCATTGNISEYFPIADTAGASVDIFGYAVAISGNHAIVGSPGDDGPGGVDQGSVSIYHFNGTTWVLLQKITDATGAADDYFGVSVSISGNYAIVGSYRDDVGSNANQGSINIYQFNGTNWVLMQKITDATGAANDLFGVSVSIFGNYTIVGAATDDFGAVADQGSASIYQFNGTNWVLMQKFFDATGASNDQFGTSVAISADYAIVGAPRDNGPTFADEGSASFYQLISNNWVLMEKINYTVGSGGLNFFGNSVSLSGNYAFVGASGDNVGGNNGQGSASIYRWNGSSWVLIQKLTDAKGGVGVNFGVSVCVSDNYAMIGTSNYSGIAGVGQGSVSIYQKVGSAWGKLQYLTDPAANSNDKFGSSAALDATSKRFVIGVTGYAEPSQFGKVVFGKIN